MKKILLHYPFIPSYRVPVFNEMNSSSELDLVVLSASKSNDETLLSIENGWDFKHIKTNLRNISFFKKEFDFETGVISSLFKYRNEFEYYVILSNPNILSSWLYSLLAKLLGYKVIFWGHGLLKKDIGLKKYFRRLYYKIPNAFWLYGDNAIPFMSDIGIESSRLNVIYNSLNYAVQKEIRLSKVSSRQKIREFLNINEDDVALICIGRLLDKLEIDKLLNYIPILGKNGHQVKVFVIGSGPEESILKQLVETLNIREQVVFTGAIYDEEVLSNYYLAADASVVMGVVGLAAMHSLAYGTPLITHTNLEEHCPEIEAVISNYSGEFFEKNDVNSFQDAVEKVKINDYYNNCVSVIESKYTPAKQVEFMLESLKNVN